MYKYPDGNECCLIEEWPRLVDVGGPFSDEPRGARREGHDRDHRVHPWRGRQEASIADPQIPHVVRLARRLRGRGLRVGARPRGTHRMGGEQSYAVLANAETAQPIEESVELCGANRRGSVPAGTLSMVQRTHAERAGRPPDPRGLLQSSPDGPTVPGPAPILEDRFATGIDRHTAFGDITDEDDGRRSPVKTTHRVLVRASSRPGNRERRQSGMAGCALQPRTMVAFVCRLESVHDNRLHRPA